jgi:orotate phosphoribosyltransferase
MESGPTPVEEHLQPGEVRSRLIELGAVLEGHFQLSSGLHSDRYFQCARVLQYPELAKELGRLLGEQCNELEIDLVLSPAVGGLIIGHEVGRALGRRHVFCERKGDEMQLRRGFAIRKGESVLLVDDVLTRGTSQREMQTLVEASEAQVHSIAVIVDRREAGIAIRVPVRALLTEEVLTWDPPECPLCRDGVPLDSPGSRHAG